MMDRLNRLELENKELREQLQSTQKEVSKNRQTFLQIEDFSLQLGVTVQVKETYRNCLQLFKKLLDLDYSSIFLKNTEQDAMILCDTLGFPGSLIDNFMIKKGVGLPGLVLESLQVETVHNFKSEKRVCIQDFIIREDIHSAIAVPLIHNNAIFGVIVGHCRKKTFFTKEQQTVSQIFANQVATSIQKAKYIQSLKRSDKALVERSNELESIFENSMAGILLLKGDRIIANCNQRLADFMGYASPKEMIGLNMRAFHLSDKRYIEIGQRFSTILLAGKQVRTDYLLRKKDGSSIWCEISGKALDKSSHPDLTKGIVYIVNDISKRKKMEEQLLKGQKLESLAILTGGLGHDFNNIITAILGNIDLCLAVTNPSHKAYTFLQPAKAATLRVKDLTERLQMLSRPSKPVLKSTSLPVIIRKVAAASRNNSTAITYDFSDDLKNADIDPGQIATAFGHLVVNSIQAMGEAGNIHIQCSNYTNRGDIAGLHKGNYIKTSVHDNGHGISPEIFDKIFDPYFTTRSRSKEKGSGLGLATVLSIMKRHKGFITADSNIDEGATFTIYLPATKDIEKETVQSQAESRLPERNSCKGKILLMDDNEDIQITTRQMLSLIGYEVEVAADGRQALNHCRQAINTGTPFDLFILDLNIINGGMGGVETAAEILQQNRAAKIIVTSGDSLDSAMLDYKKFGFTAALTKPFEFAELHKILTTVLNS